MSEQLREPEEMKIPDESLRLMENMELAQEVEKEYIPSQEDILAAVESCIEGHAESERVEYDIVSESSDKKGIYRMVVIYRRKNGQVVAYLYTRRGYFDGGTQSSSETDIYETVYTQDGYKKDAKDRDFDDIDMYPDNVYRLRGGELEKLSKEV
ncbi:hypothetical protein KW786_03515 [Candidatus Parcubacteria bacterium]|nr:hypothetical protein [Candidatus Parcubacteria bacterium]